VLTATLALTEYEEPVRRKAGRPKLEAPNVRG
jgi:hypothetical protein